MSVQTLPEADHHTTSLVATWAILVVLTLLSYWLRDHNLAPWMAVVAILSLTFVKVFMVGHSFMEIRRGPMPLKLVFTSWCVATCAIMILLAFIL